MRRGLFVAAVCVLAVSCGERKPEQRVETYLSVEAPVKVTEFLHSGIVRDSAGTWYMAAFTDPKFEGATEEAETIAVYESKDECATWKEVSRIKSVVTYGVWGYDMAVGEGGRLYLTWVCGVYEAEKPSPFKAIMFSRSDDGGRSWTKPKWVNDLKEGQRSGPAMAVRGSNVYVAWLDCRVASSGEAGHVGDQTVFFASSGDRGETWSANQCIETEVALKTSFSSAPTICAGGDGKIYCSYYTTRRRPGGRRGPVDIGGWWVSKSSDGGKTFEVGMVPALSTGVMASAADGKNVYVGIVSGSNRDAQVYVSSDGGGGWDKLGVVDDDLDGSARYEMELWPVGEGRLAACWDDKRGGVYMAVSVDGGETWGKNVRVAARSTVGITPIEMAVDGSTGRFAVLVTDVRQGEGDGTYMVRGKVVAGGGAGS